MNDATLSPPASRWALLRPYLLDIVTPFLAYFAVAAFGAGAIWALTAAGLAAAISAAVNTLRQRGLDAVGVLVLLEIIASLLIVLFVHDPRLMLVRPSFYTAVAAVYLMYSAVFAVPVSYPGSRAMAAAGGPARIAAYERAWERSAEFRATHRFVTFGFGVGLALDSLLRVLIVYRFPIERSAWLSNVPHVTAVVLMIAVSALAGRRFKRLVDQQL